MSFGLLALCALGAALIALWRRRLTLFIFAANQGVLLRALDSISTFGQPNSQAFLPRGVFSSANLEVALGLCAFSTALLLLFVLLPGKRPRAAPGTLPPLPGWIRWGLAAYLVAVIASQRTLLTQAYGADDRYLFNLNLSGAHALLLGLALYEVGRRVIEGIWRPLPAFAGLLVLFVLTDFAKGQTGIATGALVTGAFLVFGGLPRRRQAVALGVAVTLVAGVSLTIRGVRHALHREGLAAFPAFFEYLQQTEDQRAARGEGVEVQGNGVQYAAHVLECVSLREAGVSREWRSIYLPLVYTVQPSFIMNPLGLERPKEAAWELADYFRHLGGIYYLGELYWNGGWLCVVLVATALFGFAYLCDLRLHASFTWMTLAIQFGIGLAQGVGYGFAQISRGLLNGLLVLAVAAVARTLRARRREAVAPIRPPPRQSGAA